MGKTRLATIEGVLNDDFANTEFRVMLKVIASTENSTVKSIILRALADKYPELEEHVAYQLSRRYKRL